jgi:hypothetical protein
MQPWVGLWWLSRYSTGQQIQTAYAAVPRSNPAVKEGELFLYSHLNGARTKDCVSKTNLGLGGVPTGVKKVKKKCSLLEFEILVMYSVH